MNTLENAFVFDTIGRLVINDEQLLRKIDGAVMYSDLLDNMPDTYCNATCNTGCPKVNSNCINLMCGCF